LVDVGAWGLGPPKPVEKRCDAGGGASADDDRVLLLLPLPPRA
jgi:hypothetical protein